MKLSLGWLQDHLAERLDTLDLEKRFSLERCDPDLPEGVVPALIKKKEKHPDADRLSVCICVVEGRALQIVCGDPAIYEGQWAPLALPETVLPSGIKIKKSRIRGVESWGMLCSREEMGMEGEGGVVDLDKLNSDGSVWTLEVPFNRPDLLSVRGVAREVGLPLQSWSEPEPHLKGRILIDSHLEGLVAYCEVELERGDTPEWMVRRLQLQGQQSRTLPVDLTNYLLYDLGQPLHAFDLDRIDGNLSLRFSQKGEKIQLLSGRVLDLPPGVPVMADERGPVSIVGVMGGLRTACTAETQRVLLESTYLDKRLYPHKLGIESQSGKIFARGLNRAGPLEAIGKARHLLHAIPQARFGPLMRIGGVEEVEVRIDPKRVVAIGGTDTSYLTRSGFKLLKREGEKEVWRLPSWRQALSEEGIAEEAASLRGYEKIEAVPLDCYKLKRVERSLTRELRLALLHHNLREVLISPLTLKADRVKLSKEGWYLRSSLIPDLKKLARFQLSRRSTRWAGIFEIGTCFDLREGEVEEKQKLAVLLNTHSCHLYRPGMETLINLVCEVVGVEGRMTDTDQFEWGEVRQDEEGEVLEMVLPQELPPSPRLLSPKNQAQSSRDLTLAYEGSPRNLYLALKGKRRVGSDVGLLYRYHQGSHQTLTFRIWSLDEKSLGSLLSHYVKVALKAGARLP